MKRRAVILILFLTSTFVMAQNTQEEMPDPGIAMIGRAQKDRILLRWAPNNATVWQFTLQYGFVLERFTITRNNQLLDVPERITLGARPIKALPVEQWETIAEEDDWAGIAAEAIYGEKFELTESFSSDIASVINKVREIDNRYTFAMFAADQSRRAAQASGLYFEDPSVKANEKYLYRVYTPVPADKMKIDTGFVYIGLADFAELPVIADVESTLEDKTVIISWAGRKYNHVYNSFVVERSDDGGSTYHSISDVPIVNTSNTDATPEFIFKTDTLPSYDTAYFYRVRGMNAFGEISEPSEPIAVISHPLLHYLPRIYGTTVAPNGTIAIRWQFPEEGQSLIKGFRLYRSDKAKGNYKVVEDKIAPDSRSTIDPAPSSTNYYIIAAFDQYENETKSFPSLSQLEDSIPPLAPVNLKGVIDTTGVVTISWDSNKEPDLYGYRVYRANLSTEEYVQVTPEPVKEPVFIDTIELRTLTESVYYKISAIDSHYNPSDYSDSLVLKRPDIVPPAPPVFESINNIRRGINIRWIKSSSEDAVKHVLYRRSASDAGWVPIYIDNGRDSAGYFTDSLCVVSEMYAYTVIAVDDAGLESIPAKPIMARRADLTARPAIEHLNVNPDRNEKRIQVSWRYAESEVINYRVYRAEEDGVVSLHKVVPANASNFSDKDLKTNTVYRYMVQAEFRNGILSPLSKEVSVNF